MDITNSNKTITEPYNNLGIYGQNNRIKICSHIQNLELKGNNNNIDGTDWNCKIDNIKVNGNNNRIQLNQNCANVNKNIMGAFNSISIGNNMNFNFNMQFPNNFGNNNNNRANNFNEAMDMFNFFGMNYMNMFNNANNMLNNMMNLNNNNNNINNMNNMNNMFNNFYNNMNYMNNMNNNMGINNNNIDNNNNVNNNENSNSNSSNRRANLSDIKNSIMASVNMNSLSDFEQKKLELTLEMDEYQYKHIQKYESRKETECAICLADFEGTDIIKAFYKCEHIFHKKCLLDWLKKNNKCPLCNHDLSDDIKEMQ